MADSQNGGATAPDPAALEQYRARARAWLEANLAPRSAPGRSVSSGGDLSDEDVATQKALQRRVYEAGYAGITVAREYGGQGLHPAYERAFQEEARHFEMPDLGNLGGATLQVCLPTMLAHASPAFLKRHVPSMLAGDVLVAQFFSDTEAGSDLAGVRTQAIRDGDRWILNGSKVWSSGAYYADYGMCLARTDLDVPKHRGLTWFLVPVDAPGLTLERIRQINGNAEFCQEYFTDVELDDDAVIGEVNDGWRVTRTMLIYERGAAHMGGGAAPQERRGVAPDLVSLATAAGRRDDPRALDLIARAHVDDLAKAALGQRIGARMVSDPGQAANIASYGKLASGIFDPVRAERAMEIAGTTAIAWEASDDPGAAAALGLLNSKFMAIAGGTTQMQRNTIGEKVLGLPREPSFDSTKPFRQVIKDARNWSGQVG